MASSKTKHAAPSQGNAAGFAPSTPQKSGRPHKSSRKGKAKEDDTARVGQSLNEAAIWDIAPETADDLEDVAWPWISLTDSSASRQPPVFTKDGSYFFSIVGSSVKIYSTATGQVVSTLSASPTGSSASRSAEGDGHTDIITAAIINPHNEFQLLTGSMDGCIKVWDFLDAVLLQTVDISQPILHLCAHEQFKDHVFVSVARPTKKKNSNGNVKEDNNAAVLRVFLKPSVATAQSRIQRSSEIVAVGKTRSTAGLAVSPSGAWLVAVAGHKSYVAKTSSLKSGFTKFVSPEALTCMAFHPSEEYFATGDEKGNIRLWYCLNEQIALSQSAVGVEKKAQTTLLHWHAHAVASLAFTPNGAYLLSGGEESVLVIWQLHSGKKEYVPRVGSPIVSISVARATAREEEYLLGLADATFVFINAASLKISRAFSRIKLDPGVSHHDHPPSSLVPMAVHSQTSSLVLPSSHPSSLQIYSPASSKLLSELEVSPSNRVSRRDEEPLKPSCVQSAVISSSGEWMATVDEREDDGTFRAEIYLKVWWWDSKDKTWILNTRVDRPHGLKKVTAVVFSTGTKDQNPYLVTTGDDGNAKIWGVRTTAAQDGGLEAYWVTRSTLNFRSEIPSHASWSPDGSLLVICFGPYVAIYDPTTNALRQVLTSPESLTALAAHPLSSGRHLVVVSRRDILLWDLLTETVAWHYQGTASIDHVVPHLQDESFVVIQSMPSQSQTRALTFLPASDKPVQSRTLPFRCLNVAWHPSVLPSTSNISGFSIVGITATWSVVLFGDDVRLPEDEGAVAREIADVQTVQRKTLFHDIFGTSAFADLSNGSAPTATRATQFVAPWSGKEVAEVFDAPTHLMPPMDTLFDSLMDGFLNIRTSESVQEEVPVEDEEGDIEMDVEDGPVIIGTRPQRVVDDREMSMFVNLFSQHAVKGSSSAQSTSRTEQNGHKINGLRTGATNGNGHAVRPSLTNANGSAARSKTSAVTRSNDAEASAQSSPVAAGKKRKKY